MTTDTTTPITKEQTQVEESAPSAQDEVPQKITLAYLLNGVERSAHAPFEEWALDFYNEAHRRLAKARTRLFTMERLGVAVVTLQAERSRLALWEAQMITAQFLSCANPEEADLDYTDPKVLKYFALWLWDTDHCEGPRADPSPYTYGPLDWTLYLGDELLNLASFGLR